MLCTKLIFSKQGTCIPQVIDRFCEKYLVLIKWGLCKYCLQNERTLMTWFFILQTIVFQHHQEMKVKFWKLRMLFFIQCMIFPMPTKTSLSSNWSPINVNISIIWKNHIYNQTKVYILNSFWICKIQKSKSNAPFLR